MRAVSVLDIARRLEISHSTVSRVLNGNPIRVSAETRRRILKVAEELNYRPNALARAMRDNLFEQIGLLLDYDASRNFFPLMESPLLAGAVDYLVDQDWRLVTWRSDARIPRNPEEFSFVRTRSLDAIIVLDMQANLREVLVKLKIPHVTINAPAAVNTVTVDDFQIGLEATNHLLGLGHRRIVFYAHRDYPLTIEARRRGYEAAMRQANLPFRIVLDPHPAILGGKLNEPNEKIAAAMRKTFQECLRSHQPTALLTLADYTAYRLYLFLAEEGLSIPRDISVLSLDASQYAQFSNPPLSAYRVRFYEMGKAAAEMAYKLATRQATSLPGITIGADLWLRSSVGPPR